MLSKQLEKAAQDCKFMEQTILSQSTQVGQLKKRAEEAERERDAAMLAGVKLDIRTKEVISGLEQRNVDLVRKHQKYKGTLAEQDALIASLREQLEDANNIIGHQEARIEDLTQQVSTLGQRLDAYREKRAAPYSGSPAHGSCHIDSPYHKDNNPRN